MIVNKKNILQQFIKLLKLLTINTFSADLRDAEGHWYINDNEQRKQMQSVRQYTSPLTPAMARFPDTATKTFGYQETNN